MSEHPAAGPGPPAGPEAERHLPPAPCASASTRPGTFVVSLVSSPGSGKTAFLEECSSAPRRHRVAALVGDLATDNDARRLARSRCRSSRSPPARSAIWRPRWSRPPWRAGTGSLDFLFIENVGNLVCPSTFDLGEDLRLVLFSVTEGEDKPLKYPTIFNTADVALITKTDLADAVGVRRRRRPSEHPIRPPGMEVFEVSAKTGGAWSPGGFPPGPPILGPARSGKAPLTGGWGSDRTRLWTSERRRDHRAVRIDIGRCCRSWPTGVDARPDRSGYPRLRLATV